MVRVLNPLFRIHPALVKNRYFYKYLTTEKELSK